MVMLGPQMGLKENIERVRLAAGYENAAAFARLIGVSPGTLGDWEAGRYKNLRLENLLRIAKGAKCELEDLVVGVDQAYDRLRRDLPRHTSAGESAPLQRGSDVPASARARLQQLELDNQALKARLGEVQTLTRQLFRVAVGRKARKAPRRTS